MITKYLIPIIAILSFAGGSFFGTKVLTKKIPPCPACNCPPATEVHLADFDVEKLNNKKGTFNYNPSISNVRIVIEARDSAVFKEMIRSALKK
jgi:hypothetical protein